jgi:hypothetical protein
MAAQTCILSQHATLSGTTADSVAFSGRGSALCVTNRDTTNTLYFTINGVTAVAAANAVTFDPNDAAVSNTTLVLGGAPATYGAFGDYDIGETLVYNTALSNPDKDSIHSYLKTKWGTP